MDSPLHFASQIAAIKRMLAKRRLGFSAKSPFANRAQRVVRLLPSHVTGSYMHHDKIVRAGLDEFEENPSRRSWAAWKATA
jgi:hypothetical protein